MISTSIPGTRHRVARLGIFGALVAGGACAAEAPSASAADPEPAALALHLTPPAHAFEVGTEGHVQARIYNRAGEELRWTAPRRLETSDSAVLRVTSDDRVLAARVGRSWLRVTWSGSRPVRDSILVSVGASGVGIMRFFPVAGTCWGIQADSRTVYEPAVLPAAFRSEGLRVRYRAKRSERGSFCGVGAVVELDSISVAR